MVVYSGGELWYLRLINFDGVSSSEDQHAFI